MKARLTHNVDFDRPGTARWCVRVQWERPTGEFGEFRVPIVTINQGKGPAVMLSGGVHGDEFEGPACLWDMIATGAFDGIRGRLIVIPAMNPPALAASQRCSPIDGQDMNRSFSMSSDETPTNLVTRFISNEVIPRVDAVFDLHAGGYRSFICPSIMTLAIEDDETYSRSLHALDASGLPVVLVTDEFDDHGMIDGEALRQGKTFGCAELGSAGTLTPDTLRITRECVSNLLRHQGCLEGDPVAITWCGQTARHYIRWNSAEQSLLAPCDGFFVPGCEIGSLTQSGDELGWIVPSFEENCKRVAIVAATEGYVYIVSAGGPVEVGEKIAVVTGRKATLDELLASR